VLPDVQHDDGGAGVFFFADGNLYMRFICLVIKNSKLSRQVETSSWQYSIIQLVPKALIENCMPAKLSDIN